jgi:hypothetical protein
MPPVSTDYLYLHYVHDTAGMLHVLREMYPPRSVRNIILSLLRERGNRSQKTGVFVALRACKAALGDRRPPACGRGALTAHNAPSVYFALHRPCPHAGRHFTSNRAAASPATGGRASRQAPPAPFSNSSEYTLSSVRPGQTPVRPPSRRLAAPILAGYQ